MSDAVPHIPIGRYMSASPATIGDEQTLDVAARLMRERDIRHLPVLHGGALVGLVSERDIQLLESLRGVDPREVQVADAMAQDPYAVAPDASLDEVAEKMAARRIGSAVVMEDEKVVGIFTTVDGMRALHEVLHRRVH